MPPVHASYLANEATLAVTLGTIVQELLGLGLSTHRSEVLLGTISKVGVPLRVRATQAHPHVTTRHVRVLGSAKSLNKEAQTGLVRLHARGVTRGSIPKVDVTRIKLLLALIISNHSTTVDTKRAFLLPLLDSQDLNKSLATQGSGHELGVVSGFGSEVDGVVVVVGHISAFRVRRVGIRDVVLVVSHQISWERVYMKTTKMKVAQPTAAHPPSLPLPLTRALNTPRSARIQRNEMNRTANR